MVLTRFVVGLGLSAVVVGLAVWRGSLSVGGAIGAVIVGTLIFAMGGLSWGLLLVAFFVTSSALSHYKERVKEPLAEKFQKDQRRDLGQVLANGGWGVLCALTFGIYPQPVFFVAFAGAVATVNADTWATELGVLSASAPRLITTGRAVSVGASGGITVLGTMAALAGALFVGALAFMLWLCVPDANPSVTCSPKSILIPLGLALAGWIGSLVDSLLGATVQSIYFCDFDQKETESAIHRCGHAARRIHGWAWLDNDWVNFLSSVAGSAAAVAIYGVIRLVQ